MVRGGSSRDTLLKYNEKRNTVQGDSRPTLFAITSFLEPEELEDYVESVRATVRTYKSSMNPSLLVVLCLINVFKLVPFPRGEKES